MQKLRCNLLLEKGRPRYGWQRVTISNGGRAIGRAKKEWKNVYGGFGISSMVSRPSQRAHEMVYRCCSCTWHSTCSTTGPSVRACKCRNAGRQCTGCYCWDKLRNKGRLMPSPTTARGLLRHSSRGADPPTNNRCTTTPPIRLLTSLSLQAISAAGDRGRSAWGRASGRRATREVGGGGSGEARSKGWSGESGGSDATSDVGTE